MTENRNVEQNEMRDGHADQHDKSSSAGKMTVEEAGRKGGERTAQTRGSEFYQEIGRKGGEAVSRDRQHMAQIGRKGGEAVSRDRQHMAQIGQKGGEARGLHHQRRLQQQRTAPANGVRPAEPAEAPASTAGLDQSKQHDRAG